MAIEMLVGLNVTDEGEYQAYRDRMTPLLHACGGGFRYDFRVSEVLRSETDEPINRVFAIHFPDTATMDAFFADPDYVAAREAHFEPSVSAQTIIASYPR